MTNNEILIHYYPLIQQCVMFQCRKYGWLKHMNDILQDICLIILDYDNQKLNTTHQEKHFNAFVTGILVRQLYSVNSPAYKKYKKNNDKQIPLDEVYTQ